MIIKRLPFTISDCILKQIPLAIGILIFSSLIFIKFYPENSSFTIIKILMGVFLLVTSILGLIVFIFSKQKLPNSLLFFSLFIVESVFTLPVSLYNGVSLSYFLLKFFPIFIFPMLAISVISFFKTVKQISVIYVTLILITTGSILQSLIPIIHTNVSAFVGCETIRGYSGWYNGLFLFSLVIPLLFYKKIRNKFLIIILFLITGLSIFSIIISLNRVEWASAFIIIFFVSFLVAKSFEKSFYNNFLKCFFKLFLGIGVTIVLTFLIFPQNIQSCLISRTRTIFHLSRDLSLKERVSESKGLFNSINKNFSISSVKKFDYRHEVVNSKESKKSFINTSLNVTIGNGLGTSFIYNSFDTGNQFNIYRDFVHNYYIYIFWATGIIGLVLFLLAIGFLFKEVKRNIFNVLKDKDIAPYIIGTITTLVMFLIYSLTWSPLYYNEWAICFGILLGLVLNLINKDEKDRKNNSIL